MSGNFHDANYNVTKIRTEDGDVVELELNNKNVPLGINIEDDKEVDFDVLDYKEPVELKPSEGMESMKKITLTLELPDVLKPQKFENVSIRTSTETLTGNTLIFDHAPGAVSDLQGTWIKSDESEVRIEVTSVMKQTSNIYRVVAIPVGGSISDQLTITLISEFNSEVVFANE